MKQKLVCLITVQKEGCGIEQWIICQWLQGQWVNSGTTQWPHLGGALSVTGESPSFVPAMSPWSLIKIELGLISHEGGRARWLQSPSAGLQFPQCAWNPFKNQELFLPQCKYLPPYLKKKKKPDCTFIANFYGITSLLQGYVLITVISNGKFCRNNNGFAHSSL